MHGQVLGSEVAELVGESGRRPFDAVVVGAGSAGLTAARTLAESGFTVALLEAGPAPFLTHLTNTEVRFTRDLDRSIRGRVQYSPRLPDGEAFGRNYSCFGGRGLFWNGSAPRFQDHDFAGWPFDPSELDEHYAWAEREFRVTTKLGETALAKRLIEDLRGGGFDAIPGPFAVDLAPLGNGHLSAGIASCLAPFFRGAGRWLAEGRIRLAIGCRAQRVLLDGDHARGVVAVQGADGGSHEILARTVLLAAGGIESIRIAALSGVPDAEGNIGRGIQDHIFYRCYFEGPQIYDSTAPETAALHIPSESQNLEQWELQAPGRRMFTMDSGSAWSPGPGPKYHVMIRSFGATEKRPENRVESQEGPLGSATVHFSYSEKDEELKSRIRQRAVEVGGAMGLVLAEDRLSGPGSSYHEAGGLDMGTDPSASVTDARGRFHTVENLLSVDAASFPSIGATNPHLTIVAESRRKCLALAGER